MTGDQKRMVFINILEKTYGIGCSPAPGMKMTIQRPFVDTYNCFGFGKDQLLMQSDISLKWTDLNKEAWDFDYDNPYVLQWCYDQI